MAVSQKHSSRSDPSPSFQCCFFQLSLPLPSRCVPCTSKSADLKLSPLSFSPASHSPILYVPSAMLWEVSGTPHPWAVPAPGGCAPVSVCLEVPLPVVLDPTPPYLSFELFQLLKRFPSLRPSCPPSSHSSRQINYPKEHFKNVIMLLPKHLEGLLSPIKVPTP